MAKNAGARFALNPSFDPVRRFIRYNEGADDWREFVRILSEPLLADETADLRVTRGHILIFGSRNLRTLQVRVAPYNTVGYEVTVTSSYAGIWLPLKVGPVFDWEHRKVLPLTPLGSVTLPPGSLNRAAYAYRAIIGSDGAPATVFSS
jgi:hypothetical protein